jgi:hypothetical protein
MTDVDLLQIRMRNDESREELLTNVLGRAAHRKATFDSVVNMLEGLYRLTDRSGITEPSGAVRGSPAMLLATNDSRLQNELTEKLETLRQQKMLSRGKLQSMRILRLKLEFLQSQKTHFEGLQLSDQLNQLQGALDTHSQQLKLLSDTSAALLRPTEQEEDRKNIDAKIASLQDELMELHDELRALKLTRAKQKASPPVDHQAEAKDEAELAELLRQKRALLREKASLAYKPRSKQEEKAPLSPLDMMSETLDMIKCTVVRLDTDLRKIANFAKMAEAELEARFKEAHNEIKVSLGFVLPPEEAKIFAKGLVENWPVTEAMILASFPQHRVEVVNTALREMVTAWDGLSLPAEQRLMTARDVVANAELLLFLARYVTQQRANRIKTNLRKGNVTSTTPRLSQTDVGKTTAALPKTTSFKRSASTLARTASSVKLSEGQQ